MNNLPNEQVIELLNRIGPGNDPSSTLLYSVYRNQMFRFVRSRIGDDGVEDIVQETMFAAFLSKNYDGSCLFSTWLCSIANHKIADWRRKREKHPLADSELEEDEIEDVDIGGDVMTQLEERELTAALQACISNLPDAQQVVIRLIIAEDLSQEEAAAALDIPEGTVKSRLFNARKQLTKCMRRVFPTWVGSLFHG